VLRQASRPAARLIWAAAAQKSGQELLADSALSRVLEHMHLID